MKSNSKRSEYLAQVERELSTLMQSVSMEGSTEEHSKDSDDSTPVTTPWSEIRQPASPPEMPQTDSRLNFSPITRDIGASVQSAPTAPGSGILDADLIAHGEIFTRYMQHLKYDAQSHVATIKSRLLADKEDALRQQAAYYKDQLHKQQLLIDSLRRDLDRGQSDQERYMNRLDYLRNNLATLSYGNYHVYSSPHSLNKLFQHWKTEVADIVRTRQLTIYAGRHYRRALLVRSFRAIAYEYHANRHERMQRDAQARFNVTMRAMVDKYEATLAANRNDLQEAYAALNQEKLRRQQLEEDLRRMFLKNMTVMNMEALALFQNPPNILEDLSQKQQMTNEEMLKQQQLALRMQMKTQQDQMRAQQQELVRNANRQKHEPCDESKLQLGTEEIIPRRRAPVPEPHRPHYAQSK